MKAIIVFTNDFDGTQELYLTEHEEWMDKCHRTMVGIVNTVEENEALEKLSLLIQDLPKSENVLNIEGDFKIILTGVI